MKSNSLHLRRAVFSVAFIFGIIGGDWGQTTVTYVMQDANFPTQFNSGGDFFNQGSSELGMWANTGAKQTVAWRTFKTAGDNTGTDRSLQIGDVFIVTVSARRAFGQIGFSLNAGGVTGANYTNKTSGSRLYFNTDNYGAWYVNTTIGNLSLSYTPIQNTFKNYIFTIKVTSATTANVFLTVDGIDYRAFNITMNGSGNIDAFSIYGSDMWDGDSDENAYWKQTATVTNSGSVELGYYLTSGTVTPGLITNGLVANSTSTSSTNAVNIGGDAGSNIVLSQANTYTGITTVNANATLKFGVSSNTSASGPVGTTGSGTTITSGGVLDMNGFSLTSTATEALTINGTGISSSGALINSSLTGTTWSGDILLGTNASVGGSGNIILSGLISGTSNLTKYGGGTLTIGSNTSSENTYSGTTKISGGTIQLGKSNILPNSSGLILDGGTFSSGASIGNSETMGTLLLTANSTIALGTGAHSLAFSASNAETWTSSRTITITGWTGTAGFSGTSGQIFVGTNNSGLSSTQLAQISFSGYASGATILSSGEIVPKPTQFRSKTSGNWSNIASWESSTDGTTWVNASATPTNSDGNITIQNGHTITIAASVTVDEVVVASGGILDLNGGIVLTINDGAGTDLDIYGTFIQTANTLSNNGQVVVQNGGLLRQAKPGQAIPTVTWNSGSTCEVTGWITTSGGGFSQSFSNFTWNCTNQTSSMYIEPSGMSVGGLFKISSTGSSSDILAIGNSSTSRSLTVNSLQVSGGRFVIAGPSSSATMSLVVSSDCIIDGGSLQVSRTLNSSNTLTVNGTTTISSGSLYITNVGSNSANSNINSATLVGNVLVNGGIIDLVPTTLDAGPGRLFVRGNLTLTSGSITNTRATSLGTTGIYFDGSGTQTFTFSGGTLSTATGGIGKRFYYKTSSGPTINEVYGVSTSTVNGSEPSSFGVTGYAPLASINSFTINNSAVVTLSESKTISGTLSLSSGSLNLGGNTLTLNSGTSAQSITGSGSNAFNITNGTISLTGTGAHTKTLSNFGTTSSGGLTLGANVTLQMNGNAALDCGGNGTTTSMLTVLGTMQMNSATNSNVANSKPPFYGNASTLEYKVSYGVADEWKSGTAITTPGVPQNVTINGSSIIVTSPTSERNVKGNLLISVGNFTLNSSVGGDLKVAGNITNNATFTHNNRAVYLNGSSAQTLNGTLNGTTTTNCFPYLFIDNTSGGVTLNSPVNVTNTLTLTTGVVTTTSTNILHVINTSAAAMSGGSSTSFINGPLRWSVSNSSGGDYKFHVGKSATYLPINVNNPTGTSPVITAEAFASNSSGTAGSGLLSISSSEYWTLINTGTLSSATVSLAKASLAGNDGVGYSSTLAGTYAGLGGANASTLISNNTVNATSSVGSLASTTYFVLATKVPAPTISSFSPSSVYVGSTITITGSNFGNASAVTIGGVAATSYTVNSSTSISATVAASATNGTISVTTPGGTATSSSTFTLIGYVSASASDWNTISTWLGGVVPPSSATVTIDHAVTINGTVTNAPSSVTVNNSKTLTFGANGAITVNTVTNNGSLIMTDGGTLTIAAGGTLANGTNTFTSGSGTVAFAGSGTITGTIGFNNVTLAGGVNFGTASTINGTLSINPGGFVNINAPIYASGSTLNYNAGGTYGRGTEWSTASSGLAGYPHHLQISNGTILNLGANSGAAIARQIAGNLTVNNGATLSLAVTPMTAALTVKGNYFNYGTTFLSSSSGGDLILEGDLTDNATFTANGRAIFFHGSNIQSIFSSDNPLDIDVARFNKSGGEVRLLQNLLIDETADPVQFAGTSTLNLNGYSATFGKANTTSSITMNSTSAIKCNSSSSLTILGNGAFGSMNFDQTTPGTSNQLGSLMIDRSAGSVTLGNNLVISGILTLTNGSLSIGANTLECQNTVTVSSGSLRGGSSSVVIFSGGNSLAELKMDNSTPGTTNLLSALTLSKTGASSAVNISTDLIVNGNLSISGNAANTVNSNKKLTVNGNLTNNGELTLNSGATLVQGTSSSLLGSGTYNVKQDVIGSGGATPNGRFWYLGNPISNGLSTALLSSTGNQLWQWNESSFAYATVPTGQALTQGRSYVLRSGQNETINFSGASLSNGPVTVSGLTRTGTTQNYRGCHLISNPYPSYLDWNAITKTNIGSTMYVRTAVGSTIDVMETFNSVGNIATNNSGTPLTQYIAPMQGFWVKVAADGQTGSLTMNNSMRSHQPTGSGLRSTPQDFPAFLRFNMLDGQNKDQVILLMSPDATMSIDNFDSEKMSASGYAQFYSTVNAKKLVINGMKNVKAKTSVPLTLEMPSSKSYTFQAEEFNIEDGLILLEDKQEGVIQDLTVNPTYTFFSNAGTNATRFVVHFQLASAPVLVGGPQELESLGSDELTTDNIQITSNNQGTVIIRLDEGFKPEGSIRIFDASGRLVEQADFNDQEKTIHLNEQAGMYFVEVAAGKLMVKKKIVIE